MEYASIPDEEAGPSGVDAAPTKRRLGVAGLLVAAAACVGLPAARSAATAALYAAFDGAPPDDGGSVTLAPTTKAENAAKAAACADCDCFRNVWYVDSTVDVASPTGYCWASAFAHVGTALDAASYGDEIWVAHGVYAPLGGSRNATFRMREGVEVYGGFRGNERLRAERDYAAYRTVLTGDLGGAAEAVEDDDDTILNGGTRARSSARRAYHVVTAAHWASLDGFVVTRGLADGPGLDGFGGGFYAVERTSMRVHNTMFVDNRAVSGGAAFGWIWSSSVFYNCHFVNNTAVGTPYFGGGGGVALNTDGANATYDTCVFSNNYASRRGGALFADYGSWVSVKDCTFEHNRAYLGGALFADNRAARIGSTGHVVSGSTFRGNAARLYGGASLDYNQATSTFATCTFIKNNASAGGGLASISGTTDSALSDAFESGVFEGNAPDDILELEADADTLSGKRFADAAGNATELRALTRLWRERDAARESGWRLDAAAAGGGPNASVVVYVDVRSTATAADGSSWDEAYANLQKGIDSAAGAVAAGLDFAEVWVAAGVYAPKCADDPGCAKPQDASFALADGVRVYGGFAGSEATRDGRDWAARLSVLSGDLGGGLHALHVVTGANDTRLDGFVVRDGRASGSDDDTYDDDDVAAVADDPGAEIVDDPGSVETPGDDALALDGDDAGAQPATPSLDFGGDAEGTDDQMAVELSGDANDACGGGLLNYYASPWVENVLFASNRGGKGGAVYNILENDYAAPALPGTNRSSPTFKNVAFVGNFASERGGAMANDAYTYTLCDRCTFWRNAAGKGGAAYMDYTSSPTFSRSVFEHNFAIDAGGAIGGDGSTTFTLDGSRVVGNRARYSGGGIYLGTYGAVHGGANNLPRIHDSVVAGNDALWNGEKDLFLFALDDAFIISAQIGEEAFTLAPVSMPDGFGPVTDDEAAVPPMETIDPPRNASSDDDAKATHAARPTRRA